LGGGGGGSEGGGVGVWGALCVGWVGVGVCSRACTRVYVCARGKGMQIVCWRGA
jgi:hypothetical protein